MNKKSANFCVLFCGIFQIFLPASLRGLQIQGAPRFRGDGDCNQLHLMLVRDIFS